jgi:hypothetical protein
VLHGISLFVRWIVSCDSATLVSCGRCILLHVDYYIFIRVLNVCIFFISIYMRLFLQAG